MIDDPNRSGPNVPQDAPSTKHGDLSEAAEVEQSVCETESPMEQQGVSRRTLLKGGIATLTGLTVCRVAGPVHAFPGHPGEVDGVAWDDDQPDPPHAMAHPGEEVIPWLDQPAKNPVPNNVGNLLEWEALDSWLTPADDFFFVNHYGQPAALDEALWRVEIGGLVARPQSLTLAYLKTRPRHEVNFTLECSGNTGLDFFIGGIGNARWAGTRLAPLLEEAGVLEHGTEVIFWGTDRGTVTIRDNSGVVSGGQTGVVELDSSGGLDLTIPSSSPAACLSTRPLTATTCSATK